MIQVEKKQDGASIVVKLVGSIEENVDFEKLIGPVNKKLVVNCKGIPRINSVGVKSWIKYFQSLSSKGVELVFQEVSTSIVEQINLISNFLAGGTVDSVLVPFVCESCKTELLGLFATEALIKAKCIIPDVKCSKCGGKASFDDIPEEYFGFILDS